MKSVTLSEVEELRQGFASAILGFSGNRGVRKVNKRTTHDKAAVISMMAFHKMADNICVELGGESYHQQQIDFQNKLEEAGLK